MDFYWHYSSKVNSFTRTLVPNMSPHTTKCFSFFQEVIDAAGKANFFKAIGVASQVFNTLTEVIQGPCTLNQQALAHSRLWDAVIHTINHFTVACFYYILFLGRWFPFLVLPHARQTVKTFESK